MTFLVYSSQICVHGLSVGNSAANSSQGRVSVNPIGTTSTKTTAQNKPRIVSKPKRVDPDTSWLEPKIPDSIPRLSEILNRPDATKSISGQGKTAKKRNNPREEIPSEPYRAGYHVSLKTQHRIKAAASASGRISSPTDLAVRALETFLSTPPQNCNAANLVCALTSSAKLIERSGQMNSRFETLLYKSCSVLQIMINNNLLSIRQLSNAVWALAKFYDKNPEILPNPHQQVGLSSAQVTGRAETWDLEEQSLSRQLDELVDQLAFNLCKSIQDKPYSAKVGELAMASWAFGILRPRKRPPGWQHDPQLDQVGEGKKDRNDRGRKDNRFLIKYETWSIDGAATSKSTELTSVTDDLLNTVSDALLLPVTELPITEKQLVENCTSRIESCQWSELANLAWAFASHGHSQSKEAQSLLLAIASEAAKRLRKTDSTVPVLSRDISQLVWALGTLQLDTFQLADGLLEIIEAVNEYTGLGAMKVTSSRPFQYWNCVDIVQLVLSMAHARLDEQTLLCSLYEEARVRLLQGIEAGQASANNRKTFCAWEVSVLLWAQARLFLQKDQGKVFSKFSKLAVKQLVSSYRSTGSLESMGIRSQEQANIAWSLTVLEAFDSPEVVELLSLIFKEVSDVCQRDGVIHLEHAHQLWQALFMLESECKETVEAVPSWFYDYLREQWNVEKSRVKESSARHRALSETLRLMGVHHFNEHTEDIDVAIVLKPKASWTHESTLDTSNYDTSSVKVAVEFDGPNHFTRISDSSIVKQPRALGHTVLKYRLLKKQGWTVVRVPYFEFDKIPFWASMERQRYLQRLLKTHGNLHFSIGDISEYKAQVSNRKTRFD